MFQSIFIVLTSKWAAMKNRRLLDCRLLTGLALGGALALPPPLSADEPADCAAASRHLDQVAETANHCRRAEDCAAVRFDEERTAGCGLLFNEAERPAVEAAIEAYARLCSPHWHCRAWPATHEIDCVENSCAWSPRPATLEDLGTRQAAPDADETENAPP